MAEVKTVDSDILKQCQQQWVRKKLCSWYTDIVQPTVFGDKIVVFYIPTQCKQQWVRAQLFFSDILKNFNKKCMRIKLLLCDILKQCHQQWGNIKVLCLIYWHCAAKSVLENVLSLSLWHIFKKNWIRIEVLLLIYWHFLTNSVRG